MKRLSILMPSDTVNQGMGLDPDRACHTEGPKETSVTENVLKFLGMARNRYRWSIAVADYRLGLLRRCTVAGRHRSPPSSGGISQGKPAHGGMAFDSDVHDPCLFFYPVS
jgi:hypothetical protein